MRSRMIGARFAGQCRNCGAGIAKGQSCYFAKGYGVRCEVCGPHPDDAERVPSRSKRSGSRTRTPAPERPQEPIPPSRPVSAGSDHVHRVEFESITEVVREALSDNASCAENRKKVAGLLDRHLTGDNKWANHFTRATLLEQITDPKAALTDAVDAMRAELTESVDVPCAPRRKIRRGQDWGETLDPDRVLSRDPMPWERVDRLPQEKRLVQIGCNLSVSARVKPRELLYRGAAALALADHLTSLGYSVSITLYKVAAQVTTEVQKSVTKVLVKRPDMPMDVGALAFSMCEIAFFRCAILPASARRLPGTIIDGFGTPREIPEADKAGMDFVIEEDVLSKEAAVEWLRRCLKREEVPSGN